MATKLPEARTLYNENRLAELDALMSGSFMRNNVDQMEFNQGPTPIEHAFLAYMASKYGCRVVNFNNHTYLLHKLNITDPRMDITDSYLQKATV